MLQVLPCFAPDTFAGMISLPPGFSISTSADNEPNASSMVTSLRYTRFVGTGNAGKVCAVYDRDGDFKTVEVFAQGRLQSYRVLERPVDLEIMQDGSLPVSDDYSGKIYRITYNEGKNEFA
jgi:glucose/arabinose dehydrogenase